MEIRVVADRIDIDVLNKELTISDYKTGIIPSKSDFYNGVSPQLIIEAIILKNGGFGNEIKDFKVKSVEYIKLFGKNKVNELIFSENLDITIQKVRHSLEKLIEIYKNPKTAYLVVPNPYFVPKYNDYGHLARIQEWLYSGN